MKALIYTRVSTREQAERGLSLDAQAQRCRKHCEKYGWEVSDVLREQTSGAVPLDERAVGAKLMERLESDEGIDRLIIARLDRLCRDTRDFLALVDRFGQSGVGLVAIDLGVDLATPEGRLFHTLVVSFAEFERGLLKRRTQSGMDRARARGKHCGAPPFGWAVDGGQLVAIPEEQRTLAAMAALRLQGKSYRQVADLIVTPSKRGGRWNGGTIWGILQREMWRV